MGAVQKRPFQATMHRANQEEKTERAFQAYLDLLDAADWIRNQIRGQLALFDLTTKGFRVLEILRRDGATRMTVLAERCACSRQNLDVIVRRLGQQGWLKTEIDWLPPVEIKPSHIAKAKRGKARKGQRIAVVRLTVSGDRLADELMRRHGKVVKAFMRALDGRQQETLSVICRKLIGGDARKFISEMEHEDV